MNTILLFHFNYQNNTFISKEEGGFKLFVPIETDSFFNQPGLGPYLKFQCFAWSLSIR